MVGDPPFFSVDHFLYHFLTDREKMNQKSMWKGEKFRAFLSMRHQILAFVWLLAEYKCGCLMIKSALRMFLVHRIFFLDPHEQ